MRRIERRRVLERRSIERSRDRPAPEALRQEAQDDTFPAARIAVYEREAAFAAHFDAPEDVLSTRRDVQRFIGDLRRKGVALQAKKRLVSLCSIRISSSRQRLKCRWAHATVAGRRRRTR